MKSNKHVVAIKEEASWNGRPEDKAAFIDAYYANEGILLEVENSCCIPCGHCE